jgi:transcriptional regulator GlxA family with amidase domain
MANVHFRRIYVIVVTSILDHPSSMTHRRIGFLAFDGVQALDLIGPADAFASDAFHTLAREPDSDFPPHPYEIVMIGLQGRRFTASSGIVMHANVVVPTNVRLDTLIIPGGAGLRRPGVAEFAAKWITARAPYIRRVASVCTGIHGLATTGLLDGRKVATHWDAVRDIQQKFPKLRVEPDALFIKDGKFYTSAGISAGIDLSLALIEEDWGSQAALAVAREMVVYFKRPGGQQQFSEPLRFQFQSSDRFADVITWIQSHLSGNLSVEALAKRAFLGPRHFARAFKERFGLTPAAFVKEARLAEAGRRLSARSARVESVARSVGYSGEDVFRRAFERRFGISPSSYRSRFNTMQNHWPGQMRPNHDSADIE